MIKEEILNNPCRLTLGELKKFASKNGLTDDSVIVIERVKDWYIKKGGWTTYNKDIPLLNEPTQYLPACSGAHYKEDKDILFIDAHI